MQYTHKEYAQKADNAFEIQRLKTLLKWRKEEYAIFWATSADLEYDNQIKAKIKELSNHQ